VKTKHKIALIVIIIAVAVGAITLVLIKKQKECLDCDQLKNLTVNKSSQTASSPTAVSTESGGSSASADSHIYKNIQYGFQLTFSDIWEGYVVNVHVPPADSHAVSQLDVTMPNKAVPLVIFVYNAADYQDSFTGTKLEQSAKYVFTYRTDDSLSSSTSTITEKEIADRLATFKID
jgi:hypothetical protein